MSEQSISYLWGYVSDHILNIKLFTRNEQYVLIHLAILNNSELQFPQKVSINILMTRTGYTRPMLVKILNSLCKKLNDPIYGDDCILRIEKKNYEHSQKLYYKLTYQYTVKKRISASGEISSLQQLGSLPEYDRKIVQEYIDEGFNTNKVLLAQKKYGTERLSKVLTYFVEMKRKFPSKIYTAGYLWECIENYETWGIGERSLFDFEERKKWEGITYTYAKDLVLAKRDKIIDVLDKKIQADEWKVLKPKYVKILSERYDLQDVYDELGTDAKNIIWNITNQLAKRNGVLAHTNEEIKKQNLSRVYYAVTCFLFSEDFSKTYDYVTAKLKN